MEGNSWNKSVAMFLMISFVAAVLLTEVCSSSLPRALFRYRSSMQSKRSPFGIITPHGSLCQDARDDCQLLIHPHSYVYDCITYKGQCDVTCGVDPCLESLTCQDILHPSDCLAAKSMMECKQRLYKDGCLKTCCKCNEFHDLCN